MNHLHDIEKLNLTLLTDLYQLTMAQGYWKLAHTGGPGPCRHHMM